MNTLEQAINDRVVPWNNIECKTQNYWTFKDAYAVTEGHLLFVPTYPDSNVCLRDSYQAAYEYGVKGIEEKRWDAFNIGQNVGKAAGQTIMYPHIHMIPRREGDMADPRGGVRHVIPEKGNYAK
jgi:diadenosine tetraphosphate (Ap4A) HIT family hydrolase